MANIKVVVNGVLGKMGQEVLNAVDNAEGMDPIAGSDIATTVDQITLPSGKGVIRVHKDIKDAVKEADVVVDFTNASGAKSVMEAAALAGANCVIGSTGLSQTDFQTAEFVEKHGFVDKVVNRKDLTNEVGKLLEILLKKNSEVNSGLSNETSKNIEQTTKAAS